MDIGSVRKAIEQANATIDKATDRNEETRKTLEEAARRLNTAIGESNQAEAEELIKRLQVVAAKFPQLDKELEEIKADATKFGAKL